MFFDEQRFPRRRFNIGLFGRIEHGKGQHVLVTAARKLLTDGLDISVTFIGHVMDEKYHQNLLAEIRDNGLEERLQFVDFVQSPQNHMPCFDVIALTTYCETFGLVLVEAMRAGVAVVATAAGGVPEIVEHERTGLLYAQGDADGLAESIRRLYEMPEQRERLAAAGKRMAEARFSEAGHFDTLTKLFANRFLGPADG